MPITITKVALTGSTGGSPIPISSTQGATPATIHTLSTCATTTTDELYIYANNAYSQAAELILEFGPSATAAQLQFQIPPRDGPNLVVPGLIFNRTACGTITAFVNLAASGSLVASSAFIQVTGFVNRMVQT